MGGRKSFFSVGRRSLPRHSESCSRGHPTRRKISGMSKLSRAENFTGHCSPDEDRLTRAVADVAHHCRAEAWRRHQKNWPRCCGPSRTERDHCLIAPSRVSPPAEDAGCVGASLNSVWRSSSRRQPSASWACGIKGYKAMFLASRSMRDMRACLHPYPRRLSWGLVTAGRYSWPQRGPFGCAWHWQECRREAGLSGYGFAGRLPSSFPQ